MEKDDVAVQDVTPVEVLEAEDDSSLANFNVRKDFKMISSFHPLFSLLGWGKTGTGQSQCWPWSRKMKLNNLRIELIVRYSSCNF